MKTECSCYGALFKSIPQQVSLPSLLLQGTSVHFRPNRTNLESWAFLGWGYIWAWPSPGRSWPQCCHWGSGCVCWQCQGSSSLSSVNNWCERLGAASLRFCVCLQSCHPSHRRHHHHPQVLLSPSYSKHRRLDLCVGFFPKGESNSWRWAEQGHGAAALWALVLDSWASVQPGWFRALTTRTTKKETHLRSLGKETLSFFGKCIEMNPKYLSFQCWSSLVQQILHLEGTSVRPWGHEGCCRMGQTVYFSGWKGGEL